MKYISMLTAILSMILCTPSYANDFSYNFVEAKFGKYDSEFDPGEKIDTDRLSLSGSYEVSENSFLTLKYTSYEFDVPSDPKQEILGVGIGAHLEVEHTFDIYGEFSLINVETKTSFESNDDNGFGANIGLRKMPTDQLEVNLDIGHLDAFDDTLTTLTLGGRSYLSDVLSIGVSYFKAEDTDGFDFSLRATF